MRKVMRIAGVTLLGMTLASACSDELSTEPGHDEHVTGSGARVVRGHDGALTGPSTAAPATIATTYVAGATVATIDQLAVAAEVPGRGGISHVRLTQTIDGLRVHGAYARVAIASTGEVLQLIDRLAPATSTPIAASVDERAAVTAALANLGLDAGRDFHRTPRAERVIYLADDGLRIGFEVETWTARDNQLALTLVGGDGVIVAVEHRTNNDRYHVFVEDPLKGAQAIVNGPGAGNAESPSGWLAGAQTTINIRGNNARAYLDTDANNAPDAGGSAATTDFLTAADLSVAPSTTGNKAVAVQNLFYLNNIVHDILYRHGFNEAAGNFQVNNFNLGGAGNDPVQAEAQDGGGTDNANFSTPTDGSAPRMQMYLWSGTGPNALVTVGATDYGAYASSFGPAVTLTGTTGPLQIMSPADGCTAAATGSLTGKVAIIDRGTCNFTVKVANAQKAGALAAVLVNNVAGNAFAPGGTDRKVRIPSGMVTLADGATLRGLAGAASRLRKNPVTPLMVDGDLDSDIVFHEYGHGLTWRMIGGMSGKLAGAIGEGASDVTAFMIDGDDRIGEYAWGDAAGIRRYPYTNYPLTYRAVDGAEVHNDGEVYGGAMWRVYQNYLAAGLTADDLQDDFVDGMNFTPATPAFEDMRNGMLQGAVAARACLIWRGFAASGIGVGASGQVSPSGTVTIVESFALPATCP